eukprot:4804928-Prymnesium_polylepis.1
MKRGAPLSIPPPPSSLSSLVLLSSSLLNHLLKLCRAASREGCPPSLDGLLDQPEPDMLDQVLD